MVLPTYNEVDNLEGILGRLRQLVPQADVVIVDDSSPDGTGDLADRLAAEDPGVTVLHRARKEGLGQAYLAGFERAFTGGYEYVVEIDADGSHDPADLPAMLDLAAGGADLVIGSRWIPGGRIGNWHWLRQAVSRAGNGYARWVLRSRIRDLTAGYRVLRCSALRNLDPPRISSQGYCFQVEIAWQLEKSGSTVLEYPITFIERATGRSKMHLGIVLEALVRVTAWGLRGNRRRSVT